MSSYHTLPDEHTQRRARIDLEAATRGLAGAGDREVMRMAVTLGAIERLVEGMSTAGDAETADRVARIRARIEAYQAESEAPR